MRASDVPVLDLEDPASGAATKVEEEIRRAVREDGAECIVLGCAGMADRAADLREGIALAATSIDSGAANAALDKYIAVSQRVGGEAG